MRAPALPATRGCPFLHGGGQVRLRLHDTLLYLVTHPLPWLIAQVGRCWAPVMRVPGVGYLVSDAAVAHEILTRDEDFDKHGPGSMGEIITQVMGPAALLNTDGAPHRALRAKLVDLFTPAYVEKLVADVVTGPLADLQVRLNAGETIDLARFARLLAGRLTCQLLGIPVAPGRESQTYLEVVALSERLTSYARFSARRPDARELAEATSVYERLTAHAADAYARGESGAGSVIARLRQFGLAFDEVRGVLGTLFVVGTQTTSVALPRIVALLIDSGQMALLQRQPDRVPSALEEGLRYVVPTPVAVRSCARESTVHGHHFAAGQRVLLLTHNLARDPHLFPQPLRFDVTRQHDPRSRHLWYGAGPHFCLGFALAQRELLVVIEGLAAVRCPLRVVQRRSARDVMLPSYAQLTIQAVRDPHGD